MTAEQTDKMADGRRQRSERSRQAIVDAMLALIREGILVPTAQQVSERAGVGIRTVFRHFSDMESLYATTDAMVREQYEGLFRGGDREGPLRERLRHAVEQHALAYEAIGEVFLATKALLWRYEVLRDQYSRSQRQIRADLDNWLPELAELPADRRDMVDAVASFEMWNRLREHQGLGRRAAIDRVENLLQRIIFEP